MSSAKTLSEVEENLFIKLNFSNLDTSDLTYKDIGKFDRADLVDQIQRTE